ncbi:acyl-CoA carboxylase epsilon subunit [Streptomyces spiramenti]|uniref:Acyl-CoA carboxylase subunit epsilon n=1 Tax=Streptomyces spiramenti TaxID=2720606 RepID=A0ABX1ARD1_9ACTN|nr:acyl-CoA carboxylase epsilon subunit [Streptomyces spiramenti]NJP68276.1 acyl-CoA carboxylase subunit epsilon [Streptomyces spiramenti]
MAATDGQRTREDGAEPGTIRVVRGNPTPEELAAALAVVRARLATAPGGADGPVAVSAWGAPSLTVPGAAASPGPDTWRTSHWPA